MDIKKIPIPEIQEIELFDVPILRHGFEDYNRDYYFIIESATKKQKGVFKILFTHCFDFNYRHKFADKKFPDLIRKSWDDDLIVQAIPDSNDGYWWGQGFSIAYPGFSYNPDSIKAKEIIEITQHPMYHVFLETDHYEINLIFHDFKFKFLNSGNYI